MIYQFCKTGLVFVFLTIFLFPVKAEEGMWIPILLEQTRYQRMREMGLRLSPDDIYSINQSSLKDAIVLFGGGCTGVVVSGQGLLFTNHHCGYRQIQSHSSLEHDYLTDGFWANSFEEELPNPGLNVAFLDRMEDVTEQVLQNIVPSMNEQQRGDSIRAAIRRIEKAHTPEGSWRVDVKPLYEGNQYFMYVYKLYTDIRMVGAPPSSIGKFGGDTDNWMWPRHTGDFSIFRIYAGKDNEPADYSTENVPYQPKKYVPVSIANRNEGDFTMVYGYPASTDEYISSSEMEFLLKQYYPAIVDLRTIRLRIMESYMESDPLIRIQYASKHSSVSNAWKKWQGVIRGMNRVDGIDQKIRFENELKRRMTAQGNSFPLPNELRQSVNEYAPYAMASMYYTETIGAIELVKLAGTYDDLAVMLPVLNEDSRKLAIELFLQSSSAFFKDYCLPLDREIFAAMMEKYYRQVPENFHFTELKEQLKKYNYSFEQWARDVYEKSIFRSQDVLKEILTVDSKKNRKLLSEDPVLAISRGAKGMAGSQIRQPYNRLTQRHDSLSRIYMAVQLESGKEQIFYPDANHTLRVAFGRIEGYSPSDGVTYLPFSLLEGVMEKDDQEVYEYKVPAPLKAAFEKKDFGKYADNGRIPVCFIASNHTSGGNSGSPVFNDNGELIGLNFDRNWEGTMSDLLYDPEQCRNIIVDSRYILFITEKVFGAKRIIEELDVVE